MRSSSHDFPTTLRCVNIIHPCSLPPTISVTSVRALTDTLANGQKSDGTPFSKDDLMEIDDPLDALTPEKAEVKSVEVCKLEAENKKLADEVKQLNEQILELSDMEEERVKESAHLNKVVINLTDQISNAQKHINDMEIAFRDRKLQYMWKLICVRRDKVAMMEYWDVILSELDAERSFRKIFETQLQSAVASFGPVEEGKISRTQRRQLTRLFHSDKYRSTLQREEHYNLMEQINAMCSLLSTI